ncbi:MAG: PLP-dependent aminotransferase family protein [Pseudolabrys sp.]|nr:PLP-dependent aminotransferase family protein [Pseudolabrys sp.]
MKSKPRANTWLPALPNNGEPIYSQLLSALEADVAAGRLPAGFRMPPQRELARTLGISAGTVTKAYAEAERLGLVQGQVGRGTFVSGREQSNGRARRVVDLSLNIPGPRMPAALLSAAFSKIGRRNDLLNYAGYIAHPGIEEHRQVFAAMLRDIGYEPSAENMLITNGAQHSMNVALGAICKPGDTVLTEAATFHGMKALAEFSHYKIAGVAMDADGILPEALDQTVVRTRAKVLFTIPTLQNPTARIMSNERRREIVKIARKRDILLVEDDVYGLIAHGVEPLAQMAPERTFYVNSFSKCVLPGLRVGLLVAPPPYLQQVYRAMRATAWMGSPIASMIIADWIRDGTVRKIVRGMHEEADRRTRLAKSILGDAMPARQPPSFHIWLEMPADEVSRLANYSRRHGVLTTPLSAPVVDQTLICGMRVSIGAPERIEDLESALRVLAAGLSDDTEHHTSYI